MCKILVPKINNKFWEKLTASGRLLSVEVEDEVTTDGHSASLTWCQAVIWSPWPNFCFLSDNCWFLDMGRPLWQEDGSVIYLYNCFWALPEQSLSDASHAELTIIFYCLIWDSSNLEDQIPVFISPQKEGGLVILPATGFLFRHLLRLAGLRWR
jgi:hypothetical protein